MTIADHLAQELAGLRLQAESLMADTCIRRRYTDGVADEYGNATRTSSDVVLPCRKVPAPGNEDTTDRDVQTHEAAFLFAWDADVVGSDELVHDGVVWQVIGPPISQSWPVRLRVLARRSEAS